MSGDLEESDAPKGSGAAGIDPSAMALGLTGAGREKADAFLDDQRRMLHLQMEEMRKEEPYKLSHLRLPSRICQTLQRSAMNIPARNFEGPYCPATIINPWSVS